MNVEVVIGERKFLVREPVAEDLIKLLHEGKRFWEWEAEIVLLKKLLVAAGVRKNE